MSEIAVGAVQSTVIAVMAPNLTNLKIIPMNPLEQVETASSDNTRVNWSRSHSRAKSRSRGRESNTVTVDIKGKGKDTSNLPDQLRSQHINDIDSDPDRCCSLPLAVTLALAFATRCMTYEKLLVRILTSCETMANASVVFTDKTSTLTQNEMTIVAGSIGIHTKFVRGLFNSSRSSAEEEETIDSHVKKARPFSLQFLRIFLRERRHFIRTVPHFTHYQNRLYAFRCRMTDRTSAFIIFAPLSMFVAHIHNLRTGETGGRSFSWEEWGEKDAHVLEFDNPHFFVRCVHDMKFSILSNNQIDVYDFNRLSFRRVVSSGTSNPPRRLISNFMQPVCSSSYQVRSAPMPDINRSLIMTEDCLIHLPDWMVLPYGCEIFSF